MNKNWSLGSETNTVHLYQREISRPLLSYKFDEQNNGTAKTVTNPTVRREGGGGEEDECLHSRNERKRKKVVRNS